MRRAVASISILLVLLAAAPAAGAIPRAGTLSKGWEVRAEAAAPAAPQPAPPEETAPDGTTPPAPPAPAARAAREPGEWHATRVPSVFDARALPELYPGTVRRYRVLFEGPATPPGFRWLLRFESVRRRAGVFLNGRRIGRNTDPYTPFTVEARGLRPGRENELVVVVDGRKDPRLLEGWWNWNGIVRPVRLVPAGRAHIQDLGTMSRVRCRGPATELPRRPPDRRAARAPRRQGAHPHPRGPAPLARRPDAGADLPAPSAAGGRQAPPAEATRARSEALVSRSGPSSTRLASSCATTAR